MVCRLRLLRIAALLLTLCSGRLVSVSSDINAQASSNEGYDMDNDRSLLPDPNELATIYANGTQEEKKAFVYMFESMLAQFDIKGYNWLMRKVMDRESGDRFVQSLQHVDDSLPHCDKGVKPPGGPIKSHNAPFPGGPIRRSFGFDLSKWMTEMLMSVQSSASQSAPGLANMALQSLLMIKGIIQSVAGTILDIVPPLIPPPVWINRPLPCLPMLTGMNCLGSILYPITVPDFITADVTDSVMNGVISSFPAKYAAKVGKTSEGQYRMCAAAYLGMYCASIFPICWLPIGLQEVQTFPICFPQCLASLVACPGFWIDDIIGPCSDISIPPFCSFSIFINQRLIPPQYTSYEEAHPFPAECPKYDPLYDTAPDLYDTVDELPSPIEMASKENGPHMPSFPPMVKSLSDYANVATPIHVVPKPCNCKETPFCPLHHGVSVYVRGNRTTAARTFQTPITIKESDYERRCCEECKKQALMTATIAKIKKGLKLPKQTLTKHHSSKLGHVIPV